MSQFPCFDLVPDQLAIKSMIDAGAFSEAVEFCKIVAEIDEKYWVKISTSGIWFAAMEYELPLVCVCASNPGSSEILEQILVAGADPNIICPGGNHPLSEAIDSSNKWGQNGIAELVALLKHGADPNKSGLAGAGISVLAHAVLRNRGDMVRVMLNYGGDPHLDLLGEGSPRKLAEGNAEILGIMDSFYRDGL